jgi:hypothetical protein
MSKKLLGFVFTLLVAGLLLTACERSASVALFTTPTSTSGIPFPVATQSQLMKDILAQTQTASAANGVVITATPSGLATSTPAFTYSTDTPQSAGAATATLAPTATPELPTATALPPTATATAIVYPTTTPGQPTQYASCSGVPGYGGSVPIITIIDVAQNLQVTIDGANFPTGQTLNVRMGAYGTDANGGAIVGTVSSGASGCFSATFQIPATFSGSPKIAIRVETTTGYYGYNWFYNTNTK